MDSNKLVQQREPDFDDYDNEKPMRAESGSPSGKLMEVSTNEASDNGSEGESLHLRLLTSKVARKKADEDAKLLANRIVLLKNEEQKALKRIEETKKRAKEIMHQKQRALEVQRKRDERQKLIQEQIWQKQLHIKLLKDSIKEGILTGKTNAYLFKKEEAERVKSEKIETRDLLDMQRDQDLLKNTTMIQMIKTQEKEVLEKKKRDLAEVQAKARSNLEEKIIKEERDRKNREAEVTRLEHEELELIRRLQNTQAHQETAYVELENALRSPMGTPKSINSDMVGRMSSTEWNV